MELLKIDTIDVDAAIGNVKQLLKEEPDLSPALRSALEVLLLLLISVLLGRAALNSNNSGKPPSSPTGVYRNILQHSCKSPPKKC